MPKYFLSLILLIAIGGCSPHEIRQPSLPESMPADFPLKNQVGGQRIDKWWQAFNDPDLNQMMEKSFADNLDIKQALSRLRQASIRSSQAGTGQFPWLTLNGSGGRKKTLTAADAVTDNSFSISLSASYELDLWRKIASSLEAAQFRRQATFQEIQALYLSLSAQIAGTWYERQKNTLYLTLLNKIIPHYKDRLDQIEKLYEHGLVDADRLYQTRQSLDLAAIRRPSIESAITRNEYTLALLIGAWAGSLQPANTNQLPELSTSFHSGLPADLVTQRPDVAAAFARLQAADADIATAVANRLPTLQLTAGYGYQNNETSGLFDPNHSFWSLVAGLTQPIFDAGKRKLEVEYKKEVHEEQLLSCQQSLIQAFSDVANALNAEKAADTVIKLQKQRIMNSLQDRKLIQMRYEKGLTGYLDLIEANIQHLENQLSYLDAALMRITAGIALAKSIGGSWMDKEIHQQLKREQENRHE